MSSGETRDPVEQTEQSDDPPASSEEGATAAPEEGATATSEEGATAATEEVAAAPDGATSSPDSTADHTTKSESKDTIESSEKTSTVQESSNAPQVAAPEEDATETDPLMGGATGGDDEDGWGEQAPPLPEKPPLPGSQEDVSRRRGSASSHSSGSTSTTTGSSSDQEETTQVAELAADTGTIDTSVPAGSPDPAGFTTDVLQPGAITLEMMSSPNEPPPPYPGGPVPGADPYGPPAIPGEPTRVVQVIEASGNCPKCHAGNVMESFSFCGICLAIWLFPCGLICLFCMRTKKCSHCGEQL